MQAICKYTITKDADGAVTGVKRGCASREKDCAPDSIGPDGKFCEDGEAGKSSCDTCSYGKDSDDDNNTPVYECAVPVIPSE